MTHPIQPPYILSTPALAALESLTGESSHRWLHHRLRDDNSHVVIVSTGAKHVYTPEQVADKTAQLSPPTAAPDPARPPPLPEKRPRPGPPPKSPITH